MTLFGAIAPSLSGNPHPHMKEETSGMIMRAGLPFWTTLHAYSMHATYTWHLGIFLAMYNLNGKQI